jgi:hypothetical protein
MTGRLKLELINGEMLEQEFVQRVVVVGVSDNWEGDGVGEGVRMKFVQVWAVSIDLGWTGRTEDAEGEW